MTAAGHDGPLPEVAGVAVTHRWIDANGIRIHVAEAGQGEPLVLLHGWPQHWWMWRHQLPELAQRYRVIAPDLRGHGWSDAPSGGYEKENLATDILAVLDALGVRRACLMAHDWGAWVGYLMCLREPQRFSRYVVLNMAHPFQRFRPGQILDLWRFAYQWLVSLPWIGRRVMAPLVEAIMRHGFALRRLSRSEVETYVERWRRPARAMAAVRLYRTFVLREQLAMLRGRYRSQRLRVPTLVLHGVRDPVITSKLLEGYEPYADAMSIERVPGATHFVAEDAPEIVTRRALEFFAA